MTAWQATAKRAIDVVLSGAGLIAFGWLILLTYIAASIDCRASGFFRQERVGRSGRIFKVFKLRTMRDDPTISTTVTTGDDQRITRLGRFFRRFKLDELPQLINIFLGHMSFVGPRPDVAGFADQLQGPDRIILSVRPGITGPATLRYRNEEELLRTVECPEQYNRDVIYPDKVRINRGYVENYSVRSDMRYIFATLLGTSKPMPTRPLPPWPQYNADERAAAAAILESGKVNYWTGDEGRSFESEFAAYHDVAHAIAHANGTLALELALRVLGVGPGDEVIVTPRSFVASANCIALSGARPIFADVDRDSQNVTAKTIAPLISPQTRAILVVHLAGWPCDMKPIMQLAGEHGLKVIEDCAQAHGARIDDRPVGSFGDIAAFSFCQDKIMSTAGEGGMLITNNDELWKSAWSFKDHGKNWDKVHDNAAALGFRWLHDTVGSNYRMTEVQAAIGRIQLRKLDDWVAKRGANARRLTDGLADLKALRLPVPTAGITHAYYKLYAFLEPERLRRGWDRGRILSALQAEGAPGWSGSCPEIYREKAFAGDGYATLPVAHELGQTSIMLPIHPTLESDDIDWLIGCVRRVFDEATC